MIKIAKLLGLKEECEAKVNATITQLEEISVPDNYIGKIIKIKSIVFNPTDCEEVCITECGWIIPVKYLEKI